MKLASTFPSRDGGRRSLVRTREVRKRLCLHDAVRKHLVHALPRLLYQARLLQHLRQPFASRRTVHSHHIVLWHILPDSLLFPQQYQRRIVQLPVLQQIQVALRLFVRHRLKAQILVLLSIFLLHHLDGLGVQVIHRQGRKNSGTSAPECSLPSQQHKYCHHATT